MKRSFLVFHLLTAGLLIGLAGCVYSGGAIAPTLKVDPTQALRTVQALLTATSPAQDVLNPSDNTSPEIETPLPTQEPTKQPTRTPVGSPTSTPICDRAAAGSPIDVTVPDDTSMTPGQAFTKTWKLENSGSCTWTKDYTVVFFYGDLMGAMDIVPLASYVEPGQTIEISVEMVAPATAGPYQGNWKLRNDDGALFGIGPAGDAPFWVRIIVAETGLSSPAATSLPTSIPTVTETPLPTSIPSPTPQVSAQGLVELETDYLLDLDMAVINPLQGADLAYRTGSAGFHWLIPQGEALLGVYGDEPPGVQECLSSTMSAAPIAVESLASGLYLCYQTIQGQSGWLSLLSYNNLTFKISLEILTWKSP